MSYLPLPLSATCALLWVYLFAPIALRSFGLRVPLAINKRIEALQGVGLPGFLLSYGVFTWGTAMFLFFVSNSFFEWRSSNVWLDPGLVPAPFNSAWRMLGIVGVCSASGIFMAWLARNRQSGTPSVFDKKS